MSLIEHAQFEIEFAGLDQPWSQGNENVAEATLAAIKAFENLTPTERNWTLLFVEKLAKHENITPLTNDPGEWEDATEIAAEPMWRNKRNPNAVSFNNGMNYVLFSDSDSNRPKFKSADARPALS